MNYYINIHKICEPETTFKLAIYLDLYEAAMHSSQLFILIIMIVGIGNAQQFLKAVLKISKIIWWTDGPLDH